MALDFTALNTAVTAEGTITGSVIAYLQGLAAAGVADQAAVDTIVANIVANNAALEAAIPANTTPPVVP